MISYSLRNLVKALVYHGRVETTQPRAKSMRGLVDRLIHHAQKKSLSSRRQIAAMLGDKKMTNRLVDEIAPALGNRQSGFTRVLKIGRRRGDGAPMARIEFVQMVEVGPKKSAGQQPAEPAVSEKSVEKSPLVKKGKTTKRKVKTKNKKVN